MKNQSANNTMFGTQVVPGGQGCRGSSARRRMGAAFKKLLHVVAGAVAFFAVTATAAVLNVPGTYATISAAVAAAAANDIIQCAPGLYAAPGDTVVGIGIPLTLRGAQAGNDARPRGAVAPNPLTESVIGALGKWSLNSANITIDGFYFTDVGLRSIEGSSVNVDNISISNCVLLASTGNQGNQGNIQFAGGPTKTLHNFVFQQNYVHNPASGFLYISHTANNGVIRDNYINCGYFSFGPFPVWSGGALVSMPMGWVIAGNEFDGVIHGVPYAGGGFNAQFGDLIIRTNYVHHQRNGIGTVSIVGGSVTGNNFHDNKWAIALWGGEWTSLVSHDVTIQNNQVAYNGFAFAPTGYPVGVGIFIRYAMDPNYPGSDPGPNAGDPNYPGIDASTIHINYNCFTDLGAVAGTKAIHHAALGVNDAVLNAYSPAAPGPALFGPGTVSYSPWLTGASYSGATSFASSDSVLLKADVSASSGGPFAGIPVSFYVDSAYVGSAATDASGTATLDWGVQPPASYSVVATTSGGCLSTTPTTVTVNANTPPVAQCKNVTVAADAACAANASVDDGSYDPDGDTITLTQSPAAPYPLGDTLVTLTVSDGNGGSSTCQATVTVVDLTSPTVVCQPATVILDGTGNGSITAADVYVSSSDNCGTVNIVGVSPSSFTCANVGANTVTLTVNDGHGNVGTCQATVTVLDNEAPVLTCPPDQTLVNNLSLVYPAPTATDNCPDGVTIVCNPASGGTLTPGSTTVTCTATDASGNSDSCSFTVTVTATTTLMYNGVFLDVDGNGSSVLTATLSSPLAACAVDKPILFTVMQGATIVATATANTDASGKATVTVPLGIGVYDVIVSFAGDGDCSGSSDSGVLTVASAGDSVYGGGWYKATSAPTTRASFGLVAQKKFNKKTGTYSYSGNLVWIHHKKNRLKSTSISAIGTTTVSGYAKSALVSGTGQLSSWIVDSSYLDGGYWSAPVTVEFVATVCDGGVVTVKKTPTDKPDAFGISIGGSTIALPGETGPIVLSGGSLKVN